MKVKELIEALQQCDPEQDVVAQMANEDGDYWDVQETKCENPASVTALSIIYLAP